MKNKLISLLAALLFVVLSGCSEAVDLEELTIALVIGVDLDDQKQLTTYIINPLFSRDAKGRIQHWESKAKTLRQSRGQIDMMATGMTVGGKTQVILVGKQLLQHEDWFSLFDVFFRDAKLSLSTSVVAVDGDVSEIMNYSARDIPPLPLHLTSLIETNEYRHKALKTNLQQLDKQMLDKGITPYIPIVKVEHGHIVLKGTALLNKKGKLVLTLEQNETVLLQILQDDKMTNKGEMALSATIPGVQGNVFFQTNELNFSVNRVSSKVKTKYKDGKFYFDTSVKMSIALKERLFPYDMRKNRAKLEQQIQEQVSKKLLDLIKKCQKHQVDPIGFGQYARAFQYKDWKAEQDDWGEAFSHAEVQLSTITKIIYMGQVK